MDFDCIFDKAHTLPVPERVPFRLTTNLCDGMGICGAKGPFRRACILTLAALRYLLYIIFLCPFLTPSPPSPASSK